MRICTLLASFPLVLLAACSADPQHKPGGESDASAKPSPTETRPTVTPPEEACLGGVPFYSESPPYSGAAPHRMIGLQLDEADEEEVMQPQYLPSLPTSWASAREDGYGTHSEVFQDAPGPFSYERAQLAVCMSRSLPYGKSVVGECGPYEGATLEVVSASYTFKVFEAGTGRLVNSFNLNGTFDSCPASINLLGPNYIARAVDDDALAAKLRPLVERKL